MALRRGPAVRLGIASFLLAVVVELFGPQGHLCLEDRRSLVWVEELLHEVVAQFVWLEWGKVRAGSVLDDLHFQNRIFQATGYIFSLSPH